MHPAVCVDQSKGYISLRFLHLDVGCSATEVHGQSKISLVKRYDYLPVSDAVLAMYMDLITLYNHSSKQVWPSSQFTDEKMRAGEVT